jgi:ATP-dependent Clp protease protease subunit
MIHQPSSASRGTFKDMEIEYKFMDSLRSDLYRILAEHTGQSFKKIDADCDRDYWMTAEEAKEYGLIDDVIIRE